MRIVELHDKNNPSRVIPIDAEDFSIAVPYNGGAAVKLKDGDALYIVSETPEEVEALVVGD
jgi:aspartate 1-decarboxylase